MLASLGATCQHERVVVEGPGPGAGRELGPTGTLSMALPGSRPQWMVRPSVGMKPLRNQIGEHNFSGDDTIAGDINQRGSCARSHPHLIVRRRTTVAQWDTMHRGRSKWLRAWTARVARRYRSRRANVALTRRISVILNRTSDAKPGIRPDIPLPHAAWRPEFPTVPA